MVREITILHSCYLLNSFSIRYGSVLLVNCEIEGGDILTVSSIILACLDSFNKMQTREPNKCR